MLETDYHMWSLRSSFQIADIRLIESYHCHILQSDMLNQEIVNKQCKHYHQNPVLSWALGHHKFKGTLIVGHLLSK